MDKKERIGEYLRRVRNSKRITLVEVEGKLHIRRSYLEAIEAGDYERIPSEVYVRGFLRSYSRFLGLSPEKIVKRYEEEKKWNDGAEVVEEKDGKKSSSGGGTSRWLMAVSFMIFVVALCVWQGPNAIQYVQGKMNSHEVGAIRVETVTNKNVWIQVWVDGKIKAEGFFASGDQKEWQGKNEIQVIAGDGSAVAIKVNGTGQGNMSNTSGVTHRVFRTP